MDNLKVLKKMGRFVASQMSEISQSMQVNKESNQSAMGLENQLIVDAWNTLSDLDCRSAARAC
ncbi:MAG TPA: hypothetical protein VFD11_05030 [Thiopseudomonas sp.]|nr:hypothetical protein [Thiopseudomonas sp.]